MKSTAVTHFWQTGLGYALMIIITVLFAVPVVWMFSTALRPEGTVRQYPIQLLPPDLTFENFQMALDNYPALGRWFMNSMFGILSEATNTSGRPSEL